MNRRMLIFSALALAGCGGGGGPGGGAPPSPVTVIIHSPPLRDGWITSYGELITGQGLRVGDSDDTAPGRYVRSVVGFDLAGAGVPATATIQAAVLSLQQYAIWGSPYADLGNVLVDHVELGADIDVTDFDSHTLLSGFGVFSADAALEVKSLDVAARVQADLVAGRTFSDFRFRCATTLHADAVDDYAAFIDSENWAGPGATPALKVTYLP